MAQDQETVLLLPLSFTSHITMGSLLPLIGLVLLICKIRGLNGSSFCVLLVLKLGDF